MDDKRRTNPQNPPRQIRGRKQKKPRLLDVLAGIPTIAPDVPETHAAAAPQDITAHTTEQQDNT